MLSPAGVPEKPADFDIRNLKDANGVKHHSLKRMIITTAWSKQWSPFGAMRLAGGYIGRKFIQNYL